jgi:predicted ATPase
MTGSSNGHEGGVTKDILEELLRELSKISSKDIPASESNPPSRFSRAVGQNETSEPISTSPSPSSSAQHISKISFRGYKSLERLDLHLAPMSILTGSNNSGKSTALSALQMLSAGLRVAHRLKPTTMTTPDGQHRGYRVPTDRIPVSLENVHTDYGEQEATVVFEYSSANTLTLWFPLEGGCVLYISSISGRVPSTPSEFRKAFPAGIVCVPVLGPLEHDEPMVQESTVIGALATHRAARHFRNYWHQNPKNFERFADLIASTWPGVVIEPPELQMGSRGAILHMYCRENRITRELYWMGFGFQIWCQLLTHVSRAGPNDVLVVDEPETYLHPIVQRRLLRILRSTGAQVVLATHSAPIVMEAGPYEVFNLNRSLRSAHPQPSVSNALAYQLGLRALDDSED